ncbi:pseudouridine synthase [Violaceomyces palustris]|uniref:Pseudouridine synthase n=1 Tax=Violaceomyces palustris TaxID=1673888 RepID=A0ACD0NS74_9BASI|nr:pseudouridine synthase [Violaceomyces palustris]
MESSSRYQGYSKSQLIARIAELERGRDDLVKARVREKDSAPSSPTISVQNEGGAKKNSKRTKAPRPFDVSSQPCRKIALRFSYDGAPFSGLAAQNRLSTPLPTVEAVLWEAMCAIRLVDPSKGMEGSGWSRCGRTDRGVSAAGQVVALWVRSRKVNEWPQRLEWQRAKALAVRRSELRKGVLESQELNYVQSLNRVLPPSIRIQAWSPVRPDFSARFDCLYRHYKYFFPAGAPRAILPGLSKEGAESDTDSSFGGLALGTGPRLDIEAMRDAASRLLGDHDFRHLCKVDSSKQITNFRRRIDGASIDLVSRGWPTSPKPVADESSSSSLSKAGKEEEEMYVFNLRGTAFLYHQVRHIVAVLFLVGARLEKPSIVDELMNVEKGRIAADKLDLKLAKLDRGQDGQGGGGVRWWLPHSTTMEEEERAQVEDGGDHRRMGIARAISKQRRTTSRSPSETKGLMVYETKPAYEMASDRPLVLWECGFRPTDVGWRAGSYDGPVVEGERSKIGRGLEDCRSTAVRTTAELHATWHREAIRAEMARHFVLASAPPSSGLLASRTNYDQARFPHLAESEDEEGPSGGSTSDEVRRDRSMVQPLGNGTSKPANTYHPLGVRPRDDSVEEKNQRWLEGVGKRRAEKRGITAMQLAKGVIGKVVARD